MTKYDFSEIISRKNLQRFDYTHDYYTKRDIDTFTYIIWSRSSASELQAAAESEL